MPGELARLAVNIIGNTKDLDKSIDGSKKTVDQFDKKLNALSGTVKKLLGAGALIAVAKKIKDIGVESIRAASTAEEVGTKFNFAFKGIETQAAATADELAKTYGLAQTESKKLLGDTGDLLKGFGASATEALDFSAEIQRLSVDLADYNTVQGGAARVSRILTKSVLGNKDGLSELGVSLLDVDIKQELVRTGQDKLTGQAGKLAKAQATYTLILQQTEDAQGSFARSVGSYEQAAIKANVATADLKVEIGRAMLPAATVATSAFGELTKAVADFIRESNNLKEAEKAIAAGSKDADKRLLVLRKENEELGLQLKIKKSSFEDLKKTQQLADIDKKVFEDQITLLEGQIATRERVISGIQIQAQEEQELIDKLNAEQIAEDELKQKQQEKYDASVKAVKGQDELVQAVLDAGKSEIELIDEQIEAISKVSLADGEYNDRQKLAIKQLQEEKKKIIKDLADAEEKARIEKEAADEESDEKELEDEKKLFQDKVALYKNYADQVMSIVGSIIDTVNAQSDAEIANLERVAIARIEDLTAQTEQETALNDFQNQLKEESLQRSIEETTQKIVDLRAVGDEDSIQEANALQRDLDNSAIERDLDTQAVASREARATEIEDIEKDLAQKKYDIELAQFNASKALAAIQAAVNTAVALTSPASLLNPFLFAAIGVAGLAQEVAILSAPAPPKPQLATGAIIAGSQRGVDVTVGEGGNDELILGGGSKGDAILQRFADKINSNGGGQTINNYYSSMFAPVNASDMRRFTRLQAPYVIQENQRQGN